MQWIEADEEGWEGRTHYGEGPNYGGGAIAYLFLKKPSLCQKGGFSGNAVKLLKASKVIKKLTTKNCGLDSNSPTLVGISICSHEFPEQGSQYPKPDSRS